MITNQSRWKKKWAGCPLRAPLVLLLLLLLFFSCAWFVYVIGLSRGFTWKFSSRKRERAAKQRQRVAKRRGEREKPPVTLASISLSCRRQGQDLTLGRCLVDIFTNAQINLIGSFHRIDCILLASSKYGRVGANHKRRNIWTIKN